MHVVVGQPGMPALEEGPERAVEGEASGLQQQVGATFGPLHLLAFGEPLADDRIDRALARRPSAGRTVAPAATNDS